MYGCQLTLARPLGGACHARGGLLLGSFDNNSFEAKCSKVPEGFQSALTSLSQGPSEFYVSFCFLLPGCQRTIRVFVHRSECEQDTLASILNQSILLSIKHLLCRNDVSHESRTLQQFSSNTCELR